MRRIDDWRRRFPFVNASALGAILKDVERGSAPDTCSRKILASAAKERVNQPTPYGSLLHYHTLSMTTGENAELCVINPLALFHVAMEQGCGFADLMKLAFMESPPTPDAQWGLIFVCR